MPSAKETLAEAKHQLAVNLSLLKQLKGKTPNSMLADFRLRYVTPLEELIAHLQREVNKNGKTVSQKRGSEGNNRTLIERESDE